jgi:hypothetical protein
MLSNRQYLATDYQHTLKDSITIVGRGLQVMMTVREHNKHVGLLPADECSVDMPIDFEHPVIDRQSMDITVNDEVSSQQLAPTRGLGADSGIAGNCLKIYQIL